MVPSADLPAGILANAIDSFSIYCPLLSPDEKAAFLDGVKTYFQSAAARFPYVSDYLATVYDTIQAVEDNQIMKPIDELLGNPGTLNLFREACPLPNQSIVLAPENFEGLASLPITLEVIGASVPLGLWTKNGIACIVRFSETQSELLYPSYQNYRKHSEKPLACGHMSEQKGIQIDSVFVCLACSLSIVCDSSMRTVGDAEVRLNPESRLFYYKLLLQSFKMLLPPTLACIVCGTTDTVCRCLCRACCLQYDSGVFFCEWCKQNRDLVAEPDNSSSPPTESCLQCNQPNVSTLKYDGLSFCYDCLNASLSTKLNVLSSVFGTEVGLDNDQATIIIVKLTEVGYPPTQQYPCYSCSETTQIQCCAYCQQCLVRETVCPVCNKPCETWAQPPETVQNSLEKCNSCVQTVVGCSLRIADQLFCLACAVKLCQEKEWVDPQTQKPSKLPTQHYKELQHYLLDASKTLEQLSLPQKRARTEELPLTKKFKTSKPCTRSTSSKLAKDVYQNSPNRKHSDETEFA